MRGEKTGYPTAKERHEVRSDNRILSCLGAAGSNTENDRTGKARPSGWRPCPPVHLVRSNARRSTSKLHKGRGARCVPLKLQINFRNDIREPQDFSEYEDEMEGGSVRVGYVCPG